VGLIVLLIVLPAVSLSATAAEPTVEQILDKMRQPDLGEGFRFVLTVTTTKNNKTGPEHVLWLMGKTSEDRGTFFIEFDEPAASKGMRFLVRTDKGEQPEAYMFLPATNKTMKMATTDTSVDLAGTGLTIKDLRGMVPQGREEARIVGEETVKGRPCWQIEVTSPDEKGKHTLWVSKKDYIVVKARHTGPKGDLRRTFEVVEFFRTEDGREFPRAEKITIPPRNTTIRVRQENAVFGVTLPDELFDEKTFGSFKWRP
jgi:hypothetical protein